MRLYQYINESTDSLVDIFENMKKDCSYYFDKSKKGNYYLPLYRRVSEEFDIKILKTQKDRIPRDTPINVHKLADKLFKRKFGWKVRSEGVFCSGTEPSYYYGGNLCYIFPIGRFKFVYSKNIADFTNYLFEYEILNDDYEYSYYGSDLKGELKEIVNEYTNTNLIAAIESRNEISIKCDRYYAINVDYYVKNKDLFEKILGHAMREQ